MYSKEYKLIFFPLEFRSSDGHFFDFHWDFFSLLLFFISFSSLLLSLLYFFLFFISFSFLYIFFPHNSYFSFLFFPLFFSFSIMNTKSRSSASRSTTVGPSLMAQLRTKQQLADQQFTEKKKNQVNAGLKYTLTAVQYRAADSPFGTTIEVFVPVKQQFGLISALNRFFPWLDLQRGHTCCIRFINDNPTSMCIRLSKSLNNFTLLSIDKEAAAPDANVHYGPVDLTLQFMSYEGEFPNQNGQVVERKGVYCNVIGVRQNLSSTEVPEEADEEEEEGDAQDDVPTVNKKVAAKVTKQRAPRKRAIALPEPVKIGKKAVPIEPMVLPEPLVKKGKKAALSAPTDGSLFSPGHLEVMDKIDSYHNTFENIADDIDHSFSEI